MKFMKIGLVFVVLMTSSLDAYNWFKSGVVYKINNNFEYPLSRYGNDEYRVFSATGGLNRTVSKGAVLDLNAATLLAPFDAAFSQRKSYGKITISPVAANGSRLGNGYDIEVYKESDQVICKTILMEKDKVTPYPVYDRYNITNYMQGRPDGNTWDVEITIGKMGVAWISKVTMHNISGNNGSAPVTRTLADANLQAASDEVRQASCKSEFGDDTDALASCVASHVNKSSGSSSSTRSVSTSAAASWSGPKLGKPFSWK